jgi:TonB-dependent starch-binding outer membrane protein SusC
MHLATMKRCAMLLIAIFGFTALSLAQTVTGKVTDKKGEPLPGVTVTVKGTKTATSTNNAGVYTLNNVGADAVLVFTGVGIGSQEIPVGGKSLVNAELESSVSGDLNEVVVQVGYGGLRKKDLTGSVVSIQAKNFNKGPINNPDQLLLGKVAGLQVINNSGQPGAATVIKIRGTNTLRSGNNPLYVIDGVPLDGRSPRPSVGVSGVGQTPDINPLNFLNPADIISMDVLKDASASAIYGSRGANGVILVTTKKGNSGTAKIEFNATYGMSGIMRRIDVLDAAGYRAAQKTYNNGGAGSDSGKNVNAFDEILQKNAATQNYSVAVSGGTDNGKYRASFLLSDQEGIIRKSGLKKYIGNFNGQYKFLDQKLSLDFNVTAANLVEQIAPVSNDAGSTGNLISLALIWNPTLELTRSNGLYNQTNPSGQVNPLAMSDAYNDHSTLQQVLASFAVGYKILPNLEYKMLYGVNYGAGSRKTELQGWIKATGGNADGNGLANVANSKLFSQTITHTLNYNQDLSKDLSLNALVGYEYWKTAFEGNSTFTYGFNLNLNQATINPNYHYYDNMQNGLLANLRTGSFKDPTVDLQSYFGRVVLNYKSKYLFTGTIRADGSSRFGANNKYAYFPSAAIAWNIAKEDFMKGATFVNSLKLRLGYGQTGNQDFNPVDAALYAGVYSGNNSFNTNQFGNANLKWETVSSINGGIDFNLFKNRVYGFVDYFSKKTTDPILDFVISQPVPGSGTVYKNLDGESAQEAWITNKGFEVSLGVTVVDKKDFTWDVVLNTTFIKNSFQSPALAGVPFVKNTGALNGQGTTNAYAQVIAHNQPLNVYYLQEFEGFDATTGIAKYKAGGVKFAGDPNPKGFFGFASNIVYKSWGLGINMHGSFGNKLYNNTLMSVLNISNIVGGRNIYSGLVGNGENTANAISPSTRFLEKGDFIKMGNATLSYRVGNYKSLKNINLFLTGTNLFVITGYTGFDPEVNVNKALNGVPSLGIDYIGYPTARSFTFGVNFSL